MNKNLAGTTYGDEGITHGYSGFDKHPDPANCDNGAYENDLTADVYFFTNRHNYAAS